MRKLFSFIIFVMFFGNSFSQKDSILYLINFFYQGTSYTSINVSRYDTGFNYVSSVVSIPTCAWGCGMDYTAFDRKHNFIYVNYYPIYIIDAKTGSYTAISNNNLDNYAFNCKDSSMYCTSITYSSSTNFFTLAKIFPLQDTVIISPAGSFYNGKNFIVLRSMKKTTSIASLTHCTG